MIKTKPSLDRGKQRVNHFNANDNKMRRKRNEMRYVPDLT